MCECRLNPVDKGFRRYRDKWMPERRGLRCSFATVTDAKKQRKNIETSIVVISEIDDCKLCE
jgi:hypothetical protein